METIVSKRISKETAAYRISMFMLIILFFGFFLTTATGLIDSTIAKQVIRFSALALAFTSIALTGTLKKNLLVFLFLIMIVLTLNRNPIAVNLIVFLVIYFSMIRLNDKEVAIALMVPSLVLTLLHIALLQTGVLSESTYEVGERTRSTLGFANANQLSMFYTSLICVSYYTLVIFRNRRAFLIFLISIAISFQMVQSSDSRTGLAITAAIPVLYLIWAAIGRISLFRKIAYALAALSPMIATAVSFFLALSFDPVLNFLLSERPYWFGLFLNDLDLYQVLFGWRNENNVTVDNAYLLLFSAIGAVLFIFVNLISVRLLLKVRFDFLPIVFILLYSGIVESALIRPEIPASLMFFRILLPPFIGRQTHSENDHRNKGKI